MAKFGKRSAGRKGAASRKQAKLHLSGAVFEEQRKALTRQPGFPRAFYAFSLTHGISRLDGDDEIGEIVDAEGAGQRIRERVITLWQKMGHVVIMYEGVPRLAVLEEA